MTVDNPKRLRRGNAGLVRQLLNDAEAECYRGCVVSITARVARGANQEERRDSMKERVMR